MSNQSYHQQENLAFAETGLRRQPLNHCAQLSTVGQPPLPGTISFSASTFVLTQYA